MNEQSPTTPEAVKGVRRIVYIGLGYGFVGLGVLGVILPVLPTTPFLLLASFFFVRSSPRLNAWLLRSRIFGPMIRDWQERRGVRRSVKFTALTLIPCVIVTGAYLGQLSLPLVILVCVLGIVGIVVVIRLPVADHRGSPEIEYSTLED